MKFEKDLNHYAKKGYRWRSGSRLNSLGIINSLKREVRMDGGEIVLDVGKTGLGYSFKFKEAEIEWF